MAGRIRSLKPEWLEDEPLVACSSDARVLSAALILLADDYGNGRAGSIYLASRVFPSRDSLEVLTSALEELRRIRYVQLYEVDSQRYFHLRNWRKHQKVQHPGKPLVPSPPAFPGDAPSEALTSIPENLAPDRDRDRDQRPTTTTGTREAPSPQPVVVAPRAIGETRVQIPCPSDLALTPDQVGTLETSGVSSYAIRILTSKFVVGAQADPSDLRTLVVWRKCLSAAITGTWNDRSKRPRDPGDEDQNGETQRARERELTERHEAKLRQQTEEARAQLARTGGAPERDVAKLVGGIGGA